MDRKARQSGYKQYFQEVIYPAFVGYLLNQMSARKLNELTRGILFQKKGVSPRISMYWSKFLTLPENEKMLKAHIASGYRTFKLRNFCREPLRAPIDPTDDVLMVRENIRVPRVIPVDIHHMTRKPSRSERENASYSGQVLRSNHEKTFIAPKKLTVNLKYSYHKKFREGKLTQTYWVESMSDVNQIINNYLELRSNTQKSNNLVPFKKVTLGNKRLLKF